MFIVLVFLGFSCTFSLHTFNLPGKHRCSTSLFANKVSESVLKRMDTHNPKNYKYDDYGELQAMESLDVASAYNFYEASEIRRLKQKNSKTENNVALNEEFRKLNDIGFLRRAFNEANVKAGNEGSIIANAVVNAAAMKTVFHLELGKSKEDQLKELRKTQRSKRKGIGKLIPQPFTKYYDYLISLRIQPSTGDISRNMIFATLFSFILWASSLRSGFMYYTMGVMILSSLLLARGMPKKEVMPGMSRNVATWSTNSFYTALAITLSSVVFSGLTTLMALFFVNIEQMLKFKFAMFVSLFFTGLTTCFFEVFEEKNKNGSRWKKVAEESLTPDLKARLAENFGSAEKGDLFDFEYDPEVAEASVKIVKKEKEPEVEIDPELNKQSNIEYDNWMAELRDSRRAPVLDAEPETPWIGGKAGLFIEKVPNWLGASYTKFVTKTTPWRAQKPVYNKNYKEFEPIAGPKGFRDKRPDWLDLFGTGVWEEQTTVSRKAARAFGAYRKSMWKIDKKVVLLKCDGADKEITKPSNPQE